MILSVSKDKKFLEITKIENTNEYKQLHHILTKKVKGYRFMPAVKSGAWDGSMLFYDKRDRIPVGLYKYVYDKMKSFGYKCKILNLETILNLSINKDEFIIFVNELFKDSKIKPRDYQIDAAFRILKFKRSLSLMSTSSGKTLVIYIVIAYGLKFNLFKNILIIVPNISLVIQTTNNLYEYSRKHNIKLKIQQIYHGSEESFNTNITIGTFQSLTKSTKEYLNKFDVVIVDETHKAKTKSILSILKKMNCEFRFGVTGTLPEEKYAEYLSTMAYLGPIVNNINADKLIKEGYITPIKITILHLDYLDKQTKNEFYELSLRMDSTKLFQEEKHYIIENKKRLKFLINLIENTEHNSLVLFHLIDYGKTIYEHLSKLKKKVYYVDGNVKVDDREHYIKMMDKKDNQILVASYGTFSTGISINAIYNIFLVESFKSDIIVRQSLGRGLRLHENKNVLNVIDIVDDFSFTTDYGVKYENYMLKHSKERLRIYKKENFPHEIKKIKL